MQKGETLFGMMVEDLCALVRRGLIEQPPLENSYFAPVL
jgi:hypothetical protein